MRRRSRLRGSTTIGVRPEPARPLEAWSADLARAVSTGAVAPRWRAPGFASRVDAIRDQLAPILDRASLMASWRAEAVRWRDAVEGPGPAAVAPLDLAYAVRWLELGPSGPFRLPAWRDLLVSVAD